MPKPFNKYQDYDEETDEDAYDYEYKHYLAEEEYREKLRNEIDHDYFNDNEEV